MSISARLIALAASLTLTGVPVLAQSRLAWGFSEGGEDEVKIGLAAPGDNNYAGFYLTCRRGSGEAQVNIQLPKRSLAPLAEAIRKGQSVEVTLKSGAEESIAYPDLGFDQHDGAWQLQVHIELEDPAVAAFAASGRLEVKGAVLSQSFAGTGMAKAWAPFAKGCAKP